ncbi:hypothetical protein PInf_009166 [Phytophthora infestans]|nr:hypothetical protein PInf_009166 [Phytophthora infestans]
MPLSELKPVCSKTLKVYIGKVVADVETKISAELDGPFGIMFDGSLTTKKRKAIKRFEVTAVPSLTGRKRKNDDDNGKEKAEEEEDFATANRKKHEAVQAAKSQGISQTLADEYDVKRTTLWRWV